MNRKYVSDEKKNQKKKRKKGEGGRKEEEINRSPLKSLEGGSGEDQQGKNKKYYNTIASRRSE